eukprot:238078_1
MNIQLLLRIIGLCALTTAVRSLDYYTNANNFKPDFEEDKVETYATEDGYFSFSTEFGYRFIKSQRPKPTLKHNAKIKLIGISGTLTPSSTIPSRYRNTYDFPHKHSHKPYIPQLNQPTPPADMSQNRINLANNGYLDVLSGGGMSDIYHSVESSSLIMIPVDSVSASQPATILTSPSSARPL